MNEGPWEHRVDDNRRINPLWPSEVLPHGRFQLVDTGSLFTYSPPITVVLDALCNKRLPDEMLNRSVMLRGDPQK